MRRHLLVANQTLTADSVTAWARQALREGPAHIHVVAPATPPKSQLTWNEGEATKLAEERLDEALERLEALGATVSGEVGAPSPVEAVGDVLRHHEFDEIVVSTLPALLSRWLRQDVIHRLQRRHDLLVRHLEAELTST